MLTFFNNFDSLPEGVVDVVPAVVVLCGKYKSGHFAAQKRFRRYGIVSADVQNE